MNKTCSFALATSLLSALVVSLTLASSSNAVVAVQYTTDYARINAGGGIAATSSYNFEDEIRLVGSTAGIQSSTNYLVSSPSFEEIIAATPSIVDNWQDYR